VPQQFIDYVVDLSSLDFGESWVDQRLVTAEVSQRLAVTSGVATMALALIVLWIVFAFVLASSRHGRRLLGVAQFAFVALPTLFMGVLVALVAVEVYPYSRFQGTWDLSDLLFFLPPAAVLALYPAGAIGQLVCQQTSILEQSDMVRAARARGVTVNQVRWRYVARTAAIPIIAALFNQVPLLITSSFVVEIIFSVPGIGAGLLNAVMQRDLPMVEGIVIFTSLVTLVTSRLGDLLYPLIDPRIVRSVN
jgi:peptide/nickel transport system permease protein